MSAKKLATLSIDIDWADHVAGDAAFYCYVDVTREEVPFYVGKGSKQRVRGKRARNDKHAAVAQKHGIKRIVMFSSLDETKAFGCEVKLINELNTYAGGTNELATNFTHGGDGTSGHKVPDWVRAKVSQRQLGEGNVAKRHDVRAKIVAANTGVKKSKQCVAKIVQKCHERHEWLIPIHKRLLENDVNGIPAIDNLASLASEFNRVFPAWYVSATKSAHKLGKCAMCRHDVPARCGSSVPSPPDT